MSVKIKSGQTIKDPGEIQQVLSQALTEDHPFKLRIDKQVFTYYTRFTYSPELAEDIENGIHLLIAPLDPPIGNIKIIKSKKVTLELFTEFHLVTAICHFVSRPNPESFELSFPKELILGKQKRDSVRVKIDPAWELAVKAIRPSGIPFTGIPTDISTGGICFFSEASIPIMTKQLRLQIIVQWPARNV
ncbi:MAG: hypothetical protein HQL70_11545, partial [Magnetococcales bacterium]|nr:hypothetical protein [Magnetococcales bacterium]